MFLEETLKVCASNSSAKNDMEILGVPIFKTPQPNKTQMVWFPNLKHPNIDKEVCYRLRFLKTRVHLVPPFITKSMSCLHASSKIIARTKYKNVDYDDWYMQQMGTKVSRRASGTGSNVVCMNNSCID